ncbi:MAG: metalloregulator ArsR/SmtB family transcription factor, partial [Planctomycetes bacterium]|nr:metalloregulator ArsR/SmtB family transcription factor [Planctomycetota bacterium]
LSGAARAFGALAHAARLELFRILVREGAGGLPAGELAERAGLPASTLSFHLHELTAAGLLTSDRDGRRIRYAVRPEAMRQLLWFLGEDCCQGRTDLLTSPTGRIEARLRDDADASTVIAFVCTHNTARSQMAEALLRHHGGDRFDVLSAGMRPRPVHPLTLRVLQEIDVPTDGLVAKDLGEVLGKRRIDRAIVLCPQAQEDCPKLVPFARAVEFWPFPDPTEPAGSSQAQLRRFRAVRDAIETRLGSWLEQRHGKRRQQPRERAR